MKIIIALAIVALAGCASRRAYDRAIVAHGVNFIVPMDSASVMWERAQRWLAHTKPVVLLVSNSLIESTPAQAGAPSFAVAVLRSAAGDSVSFEVDGIIWREAAPAYRDSRTRQYIYELSYYIHYGITSVNFSEPVK